MTISLFHQPKFNLSERDYRRLPKFLRFAYLILETKGDGPSIRRLLQAVYHPMNYYVFHLDLEASDSEGVIREFGNVMVIGKADLVTYNGPTMISSKLHAVAILLKEAKDWVWFLNLSASDYPLMSHDV
ncbi:Glycosyl transferase, family 14 [Corchorus olitorius]|uniref:Glycosyl transferase, family 14 n=1 Tax=Corchorus olitorius TaxID=93759 RepID=A0A1R3GYG6_9ROSI|nr:Glycosyl transferase, family 14 [Corchorus olitorius]